MKYFTIFLKSADAFGFKFTYNYKKRESYSSIFGGIVTILFILLIIIYIGSNFSTFSKRQNKNIIYYTMSIDKTDEISFSNYSSPLAYKLQCDGYTNEELIKLIDIEPYLITYLNTEEGRQTDKIKTQAHICTKQDFFRQFDEFYELNDLSQAYCVDVYDKSIRGVYNDPIFSLYRLDIITQTTEENKKDITNAIVNGNCELNIYTINDVIDVNEYKNMNKRQVNNLFYTLDPERRIEANIYFRTIQYSYDNFLFFNGEQFKTYMTFDHQESYSYYAGMERFGEDMEDAVELGRIFFRAFPNRGIINIKYMKITEFIAIQTTLFYEIAVFLSILMSWLNKFFAYEDLIKGFFNLREDNSKEIYRKSFGLIKAFYNSQDIKHLLNKKGFEGLKMGLEAGDNIIEQKEALTEQYLKKVEEQVPSHSNRKEKCAVIRKKSKRISFNYLCPALTCLFDNESIENTSKIFYNDLYSRLDIRYYLKVCKLMNMILYLTLSAERAPIIDFIANPAVSFGTKPIFGNADIDYTNLFKITNKKIDVFLQSINDIVIKNEKSKLDKDVLKMVLKELDYIICRNNNIDPGI